MVVRPQIRFSDLSPAIAATLLSLATGSAPAAAGVAATTSGSIGGASVTSADCGQAFVPEVTVGCTRTAASGARIIVSARAEADNDLRGSTLAQHVGAASDTLASASASATETVTFAPLAAATMVSIRLRLTGSQFASSSSDGSAEGASTTSFIRLGVRRDGSSAPGAFDELVLVRSLRDFGTFELHTLGTEQTVRGVSSFSSVDVAPGLRRFEPALNVWLDAGTSSLDWNWQFATNSRVESGFTGFALTQYSSTASILGLQFLDVQGNDISDSLGVTFASGTSYALGPAAVPEPGSWVLLLAGFGLTGAAVRRQRRQQPA